MLFIPDRVLRRSVALARRDRVEQRLAVGDRVDRAHAGGDHVAGEVARQERPHHVGQRRGGAGRRRDDLVLARIVVQMVDPVDKDGRVLGQRDALALCS